MVGHRASRRVFLLSLLALSASARAQDGVRSLGTAASIGAAASTGAADSVDVLVATRRLARGTVLRASDMTAARIGRRALVARSAARSAGAVTAGWVARRIIQAGEVLRAPAVAPAPLVAAGQAVQYTYQQDGLALTLDGVAPVAGSLGDTIPVRLGARRRVTGIVAGPAHVVALAPSQVP
ncbi:MAG: flagellar basal body P-ring formation protein FlgA [Gemmatimonadetes bacterium]|nr:flagellar basal body P-ring formation protein FlgA [Gemmatimonadota bacterium]